MPATITTTPIVWSRPRRSPKNRKAATAANAANWLPITAVIGMLSREPHAAQHRTEDLARSRDDDQRQCRSGESEPTLEEQREDDGDETDQTRRQRDPGHGDE